MRWCLAVKANDIVRLLLCIASDIWLAVCYQNSEALFTTRFLCKFNSICGIDIRFIRIERLTKMRNIKLLCQPSYHQGTGKDNLHYSHCTVSCLALGLNLSPRWCLGRGSKRHHSSVCCSQPVFKYAYSFHFRLDKRRRVLIAFIINRSNKKS
jgi:hypothetical protein